MNLKQLLKSAGVSNNIIKEVERKAKMTTAMQEVEHQEKAAAMAKMMLNDVMPHLHSALNKTPPSKPKKTIIIPDEGGFAVKSVLVDIGHVVRRSILRKIAVNKATGRPVHLHRRLGTFTHNTQKETK